MSRKKTTEEFIRDAIAKHGNAYDYSLVEYTHSFIKVKIICPKHGVFEQPPYNHLRGYRCPKCFGNGMGNSFRKEKNTNNTYVSCGFSLIKWLNFASKRTCILYLVLIFNDKERFLKVGITSQGNVSVRIKQCANHYSFNIIEEIIGSAEHVYINEKEIHKMFHKYKYIPENKIGGYTECLKIEALPFVQDYFCVLKRRAGFPAQLNLDLLSCV
jgi:hypothetical protein